MKDLPQNELLSAYLDGELTAGEQAEVERLLAASPAARQLLDELRALSATLQSLPQQRVGEDLSASVLRIAQRRQARDGEAGASFLPSPSEPFGRMVLRRFLNRRAIVWISLTAAVAVMVTVNERWQGVGPGGHEPNAIARAPASLKRDAAAPAATPAFLAAPGENLELHDARRKLAEMKPAASKPDVAAAPAKEASESTAAKDMNGPTEADHAPPTIQAPADREVDRLADKKVEASDLLIEKAASDGRVEALTMPAAPAIEPPTPSLVEPRSSEVESGLAAKKSVPAAKKGGPVVGKGGNDVYSWQVGVVVNCEISPEGAKKQALEKLLSANGVVLGNEARHGGDADQVPAWGFGARGGELAKQKAPGFKSAARPPDAAKQPELSAAQPEARPADATNVILVEATPAQLDATLAGFVAQPNVFYSFSVEPAPGQSAVPFDRYWNQQYMPLQQDGATEESRRGQAKSSANKPAVVGFGGLQTQATASQALNPQPSDSNANAYGVQQRARLSNQGQASLRNTQQQRVQFNVRVVDASRANAVNGQDVNRANAAIRQGVAPAKPAEPRVPADEAPAQGK